MTKVRRFGVFVHLFFITQVTRIEQIFADFLNAEGDKIDAFATYLRNHGVNTNIRRSRGKDIDAACGQLAVKETAEN